MSSTFESERTAHTLTSRMDRLPGVGRSHTVWIVLLGALFLCDFADNNALAYVAPAIRAQWHLSLEAIGALTAMTFLGQLVGAILGGRLADRFGRKRTLLGATYLYVVCSLVCAVAPNIAVLGAARVLTGVGLQAMTGVILVYVSEMFPAASRGRFQALVFAVGLIGIPFIAFVSRVVVPLDPGAWRWIFVIAAAGVVPAAAAQVLLPETVRWQELNGRHAAATSIVARLEAEAVTRTGRPLPEPHDAPPETSHHVSAILRAPHRRRLVVASAAMMFGIFGFYGFTAFLPTLLTEQGYSIGQALTVSAIFSVAPVVGSLLATPITDRYQRKNTLLVVNVLIAAFMVAFSVSADRYVLLVVTGSAVTLLLYVFSAVVYAYLPELFPTTLRGLGSGTANGFGRLAGFAGSFLVPAIAGSSGFTGVYLVTAAAMALCGLTVFLFGERTKGRALEDIAGEEAGG